MSLAAEIPAPAWGQFGTSVAVQAGHAVIGAPGVGANGVVTGAAYLYSLSGGKWSLTSALTPSTTSASSGYGASVAVSGTVAAVGAPGGSQGFVFGESASGWSQTNITTSELAGKLGTSVAANGATSTVMFGQPVTGDGTVLSLVGDATHGFYLDANDEASGDQLGAAIALTDTSALVGAPAKNNGAGAAYVFVATSGGSWVQQDELASSDGVAGDAFGTSIAISGDVALVGAPKRANGAGAAYLFTRSGTKWARTQEISPPAGSGAAFGESVGLTNGTAVIGAGGAATPGEVYVYAAETAGGTVTWTEVTTIAAGDGAAGDGFAASVAISGATVIAGAPSRDFNTGAAYLYDVSGILGASCAADTDCATSYVCNANVCSTPCHVCTGGDCVAGADGATCDDDNACTRKDTCAAGSCVGSNPVVCGTADACHLLGVCDPSSGVCSNPVAADGAACTDGNLCAQGETCQSGACTGGSPVICKAADACHVAGTCSATVGCSSQIAADGTPCSGGTCANGACEAPLDAGSKADDDAGVRDAGPKTDDDAGPDASTDAGKPTDASTDAGKPTDASTDAGKPTDASTDAGDASHDAADADVDASPTVSDDAGAARPTLDASAGITAPDSGASGSTNAGSNTGSETPESSGCSAAPTPRGDSPVSLAGLLVAIVFAARRRKSSRA